MAQFKTNFEDYESELVTIEDAVFAAANGTATFADGSNYVISVGADQTVLRIHFYSTSVTGTVIPAPLPMLRKRYCHLALGRGQNQSEVYRGYCYPDCRRDNFCRKAEDIPCTRYGRPQF
ncbi:MAG: hypothetical protein R2744_09740 [Bacteroidales bacterium]